MILYLRWTPGLIKVKVLALIKSQDNDDDDRSEDDNSGINDNCNYCSDEN